MKKLFFLSLLLPIVFMGCKKGATDTEPEAVKLSVDPSSIISPSVGADYTLTLTAPEAWTASCADSWVKVSPTSGNAGTVEISVKIAADKESKEASSKIVFKSGDQTLEVPVKRLAKDPARLIIASETAIQTPKDGGTYAIKVESNIKWQIASNASWAKIEGQATKRDNAVISVTVDPATTPEETVATITIKPMEGGLEEQTVTITRGASDATSMTIDKNQIDAPADGGSYSVAVTTTAKWKVSKSCEADWLSLSNAEGTGNGSFGIKVDPATSSDDLNTVITVEEIRSDYYKPVQLNVLVNRKGKPTASLSVLPKSIDAPGEGGDFPIYIESNYPWTASLIGTKIFSTSISKGDGNATMIVTVKPATDTNEATGSITISSSYGGEQAKITIRRRSMAKPELEITPTKIDASFEGGKYTVEVKSNYSWSVTTTNSGVAKPTVTSGTGNGSFEIEVSSTDEAEKATAYVSVMTDFGKLTKAVTVTRSGFPASQYQAKPFHVGNKTLYIAPGNLQYNPKKDIWRFAEHQFDILAELNTWRYGESYTENYWTDMFLWGTGNEPMRNWEEGTPDTFVDWGVNPIIDSNGDVWNANVWRTPTIDEWQSLIGDIQDRWLIGISFNKKVRWGFVIKPSGYKHPQDVPELDRIESIQIYSLSDWMKMEAAGAIFIPCAGMMAGKTYGRFDSSADEFGYYWGTGSDDLNRVGLYKTDIFAQQYGLNWLSSKYCCAVRLVREGVE